MQLNVILLAACAATVMAQPPEGGREGMRRGGPRVDPVFSALDADKDGTLSAEELAAAPAVLTKLDKNGDGKLTEDELRPAGGPEMQQRQDDLAETLMAFDKNGDGKLTRSELPERMHNLFARADADGDGVLTKEELRKTASAQKAPGEGMPERRAEGGPGGRPGMMRMSPILSALDTDQDGTISASEIAGATAALKKLDKDGDGKLTAEEVRPNFRPRQ